MYAYDCKMDIDSNLLVKAYHQDGVLILKNYISYEKCKRIIREIECLTKKSMATIKRDWSNQRVVFSSLNKRHPEHNDDFALHPYFQSSRDNSHVFFEKTEGKAVINRVGHSLHKESSYPNLSSIIQCKLLEIMKTLGYQRPVCHLSVYIPKYPNNIGSEVRPHQENTFAYTTPNSALVIWIALEKATIKNACMWGILGSNRWPLKYISRVDRTTNSRRFEKIHDIYIPDFHQNREQYTPLEVDVGDALLFDGNFVHCSDQNRSSKSRRCLSLQFLETYRTTYHDCNWLMPPRCDYLYDNS